MVRSAVLALAFLVLAACDPEASASTPPPAAAGPADTLVVSPDPELRALASGMLPGLAERSGLTLREPVRIERRSRDELVRFLRAKLDEELPAERARALTGVYRRLGLLDGEVDLRDLLISVYEEQVAGFYDPEAQALYVMDDQPAELVESVLLHELVHAVQDQYTDLDALTDPARGNDRVKAAQAAVEGHATLVMMESMMEGMQGGPVDLTTIDGFGSQLGALMAGAGDQYPELAAAPRIIRESLLFPYLEGAGFVLEVWRERGERSDDFAALIPASTEQVVHPDRFLGDTSDRPVGLSLVPAGGEIVYEDGLGFAETRILLAELAGEGAGALAGGWDGDRYVLVRSPDGGEALAWASVWSDAEARDAVVDRLSTVLDRLGPDARLEPLEVDGRPGALLTVDGPPAVTVSVVEAP